MCCLMFPLDLEGGQVGSEVLDGRTHAFQAAFNTGRPAAIRAFVEENYDPRSTQRERATDYWGAVFREVGPLALVGVSEQDVGTDLRQVTWFRGTRTRAWIGVEFELDDEKGRIVNHAVWRGVRPPIAEPASPVPLEQLADSLRAVLAESARNDHFSGVVIVSRGDDTLFAEAYGFADRTSRTRVTLNTPFPLGSITKMFTGVAIMKLVDFGRLTLDQPIARYLPEYPAHIADQVTIRHLLTHTSGIELDDDADYEAAVSEAHSLSDLLAAQVRYIERLNRGNYDSFEALNAFDYSNEGVDLLGIIVERASGRSWSSFVAKNVFEPAGMTRTGVDFLSPIDGVATGYTSRDLNRGGGWIGGPRRKAPINEGGGWIRPAGTGYATAGDMQRFFAALVGHKLLSSESTRRIMSPQVEVPVPPGLGFKRWHGYTLDITETDRGVRYVGHTGSAPGVNTLVHYYPDLGLTVIILSNFDRAALHVNLYLQELLGVL